jgi:hypothetical protein
MIGAHQLLDINGAEGDLTPIGPAQFQPLHWDRRLHRGLAGTVLLKLDQRDLFGHNTKAFPAALRLSRSSIFSGFLAGFFTAPQ